MSMVAENSKVKCRKDESRRSSKLNWVKSGHHFITWKQPAGMPWRISRQHSRTKFAWAKSGGVQTLNLRLIRLENVCHVWTEDTATQNGQLSVRDTAQKIHRIVRRWRHDTSLHTVTSATTSGSHGALSAHRNTIIPHRQQYQLDDECPPKGWASAHHCHGQRHQGIQHSCRWRWSTSRTKLRR